MKFASAYRYRVGSIVADWVLQIGDLGNDGEWDNRATHGPLRLALAWTPHLHVWVNSADYPVDKHGGRLTGQSFGGSRGHLIALHDRKVMQSCTRVSRFPFPGGIVLFCPMEVAMTALAEEQQRPPFVVRFKPPEKTPKKKNHARNEDAPGVILLIPQPTRQQRMDAHRVVFPTFFMIGE